MPSARLPAPPPPPPPLTLVAGDLAHPASHDVRTYWDACALRRLPERLQLYLAALTEEYEPVMPFLNHSCEPNVGFGGNIVLVAMSDIEAGEELSTDYALFDDYEGSMDCNCGRG